MLYRDAFRTDTMPAFFYTVALGINQKGWLVQLLCTHHKRFPKQSACDVAESAVRQHFGPLICASTSSGALFHAETISDVTSRLITGGSSSLCLRTCITRGAVKVSPRARHIFVVFN